MVKMFFIAALFIILMFLIVAPVRDPIVTINYQREVTVSSASPPSYIIEFKEKLDVAQWARDNEITVIEKLFWDKPVYVIAGPDETIADIKKNDPKVLSVEFNSRCFIPEKIWR